MNYSFITLAESYLHRLDSVALPLSPDLGIRWYGLAYAAGFVVAWLCIRWMARTGRSVIPERAVADLMMYAVVGVLVGGRLGYALFYKPELFITFSPSPPWWELLAIHRGGMASHGGILGVIVAMFIFARKNQLPGLHLVDMVAIAAPPGLFFGRLANFVNGELWGKRLPDAMQIDPPWWSVKYPEEIYLGTIDISTVVSTVGGDTTLHTQIVESLRSADPVVTEALIGQLTAWWPSQLFQALTDGPILLAILIAVWWRPRRPGVVGGWFLVGYGALRIVTEVVRQPDDGVALLFGMQRGQLLSVGVILLGIAMIFICARRSVHPIGGLQNSCQRTTKVNEPQSA